MRLAGPPRFGAWILLCRSHGLPAQAREGGSRRKCPGTRGTRSIFFCVWDLFDAYTSEPQTSLERPKMLVSFVILIGKGTTFRSKNVFDNSLRLFLIDRNPTCV